MKKSIDWKMENWFHSFGFDNAKGLEFHITEKSDGNFNVEVWKDGLLEEKEFEDESDAEEILRELCIEWSNYMDYERTYGEERRGRAKDVVRDFVWAYDEWGEGYMDKSKGVKNKKHDDGIVKSIPAVNPMTAYNVCKKKQDEMNVIGLTYEEIEDITKANQRNMIDRYYKHGMIKKINSGMGTLYSFR